VVRRFSDPVQVKVQNMKQAKAEAWADRPVGAPTGAPTGASARTRTELQTEVQVKLHSGSVPEAFIWRSRLYVVREVLAHWRERRAWWRDALDAEEERVRPGETLAAAASEQHVWRVEASPGWSFTPGVYDLAHDESTHGDPGDRWSLVRVAD